ncbi:MAG TPA: hypothetical protein VFN27_15010 [Xanthobacteraceae bacterium]|nr:hypothetical protein [Xanthobacteraceae bacterium]
MRHGPGIARPRRPIAAERGQALVHVDVVAAETALANQCGKLGGGESDTLFPSPLWGGARGGGGAATSMR